MIMIIVKETPIILLIPIVYSEELPTYTVPWLLIFSFLILHYLDHMNMFIYSLWYLTNVYKLVLYQIKLWLKFKDV